MIDFAFMYEALIRLVGGVPLTLQLSLIASAFGVIFAVTAALMQLSDSRVLRAIADAYVFVIRGTPLLVQIFLIYYGMGQFDFIRHSFLWALLREPYWCAIFALMFNTGAYGSQIVRGGLLSVPKGQIEAARSCGMPTVMIYRRIILPLAIRQALPAYGNEIILLTKATSLASIITMMEITGVAAKMIAETYRVVEVFLIAGGLYLLINFVLSRGVAMLERRLMRHTRTDSSTRSVQRRAA
ncbi:ABC transporter permease [Thalassospira alkalitolerans]|uniref:ABC transporter permease n=1 Tax=Thalassospira alkalitolerans TaxID=1293890 RepID=UPI003AA9CB9F